MMRPTEETLALVERSRRGDQEALDLLFRRCLPSLRLLVAVEMRRLLKQVVEVEDVVQESFLEALRSLESFEPRGEGSFERWLGTIALHRVVSAVRHAGAQRRGGGIVRRQVEMSPSSWIRALQRRPASTPSKAAMEREAGEAIERVILSLPPRQGRIFALRCCVGLGIDAIAAELAISPKTVTAEFSKVRARIERALRDVDYRPRRT